MVLASQFLAANIAAEDKLASISALNPFSTDGCSMFPDGTVMSSTLWQSCCIAHDLAYWQGGDYMTRLAADDALRVCVENVGEPVVGVAMMLGVRVGGSPFFPTDFRWGYGWQQSRGYKPLTEAEVKQVEAMLKKQSILNADDLPVVPQGE